MRAHPLRTLCRLTGGGYEACDFSSPGGAWNAGTYINSLPSICPIVSSILDFAFPPEKRVAMQVKRSQCPSLREISVTWGIHNVIDGNAVQAPSIILSLFSGDRQIVYAFTEATTATLKAKVCHLLCYTLSACLTHALTLSGLESGGIVCRHSR